VTSVKREAQLYVESSAVLSWLFGEKRGDVVRQILEDASLVATSELTFVECDRAILREVALGKITAAQSRQLQTGLGSIAQSWDIMGIGSAVIARARQAFPDEPIRALDALHVASALNVRGAVPELAILSLDDRIRCVSTALGIALLPT